MKKQRDTKTDEGPFPKRIFPEEAFPRRIFPWMSPEDEGDVEGDEASPDEKEEDEKPS